MDYLLSIGYEKKDLVKSGLVTHKESDRNITTDLEIE